MGNTYWNFTVQADQRKVTSFLKYVRRSGFVSAEEDGRCVVCEPLDLEIGDRVADLSQKLNCLVLFVMNDDDDLFSYELWQSGELLDTHRSGSSVKFSPGSNAIVRPDEWTPEIDSTFPTEVESWADVEDGSEICIGDAVVLCNAFGCTNMVNEISKLLMTTPEQKSEYRWSHRYHAELIQLLGLSKAALFSSYDTLSARENDTASWVKV